jgi:beta-glucanase (GH16 family)
VRVGISCPKWFASAVICLLLTITCTACAPTLASGTSISWEKVWSASFAGPPGSGVNTKYWKYDTGEGLFGNNEIETMTDSPSNVHLDGLGDLDITALDQGSGWTSGRIQTIRDFGAPAGGEMRVSASIEQPDPANGLGYWPAFWMLGPGTWPAHGEIDVLEEVDGLSEHSGALHCGNLTQPNPDGTFGPCHEHNGMSSGMQACAGCQTGYQVYSVIVDRRNAANEQIRWYLDGKEFFSVTESQVGSSAWDEAVNHGFSIILDLAMGGQYPDQLCGCSTPTGQTSSGGTMKVRSISVYDSGG